MLDSNQTGPPREGRRLWIRSDHLLPQEIRHCLGIAPSEQIFRGQRPAEAGVQRPVLRTGRYSTPLNYST